MDFFGEEYTKYWIERTDRAMDGTLVPSVVTAEAIMREVVSPLRAERFGAALDVGCSNGRMLPAIAGVCGEVAGLEIDPFAAELAAELGYTMVAIGSAVDTPFPDSAFDFVFCWAVFDALDQEAALVEFNRVLCSDGCLLVTGKNSEYREDDDKAVEAETGAALKGFTNHFTDVARLTLALPSLGFRLVRLLRFERRGDFGALRTLETANSGLDVPFYEFVMVLEKVGPPSVLAEGTCEWDLPVSKTRTLREEDA